MKERLYNLYLGIVCFVGMVLGVGLLVALPVMYLWNYLMPAVFGLTVLTYKQAMALTILSSLLFSNKDFRVKINQQN